MTLENVLEQWEAVGQYGSRQDRRERGALWQPYYSYLAEKKLGTAYTPSVQAEATAQFLLREGILQKEDHVLDIGSGMGSHSIEFAKCCARVTAMDMNPEALGVLSSWSHQQGITNINQCQSSWEDFSPKERFDVTFSSMCPAICNQEEILRMEQMTRRTCCLLTVARGSYERCRMELLKGLPRRKPGGMVTEALYYWNALYLMGRQPSVKSWSQSFAATTKTAELMEQYRVYFRIFGIEDSVSVPYMEQFFAQREKNGVVTDECRMNYALIYWNVAQEGQL